MKNISKALLPLALVLGTTMGAVSAVHAAGNTALLEITGVIKESACKVEVLNQPAMGTVSAGAFATGMPTIRRDFSVKISECDGTNVKILINGTSFDGNADYLALTEGSGAAKGLGVAFFESDGTTSLPLGTPSQVITVDETATATYYAAYVAPDASAVKAGTANASATITVVNE